MIEKNKKGFTLVEILIVVIIIGLLASVAVIKVGDTRELSLVNVAGANLKVLSNMRGNLVGFEKQEGSDVETLIRPNTDFSFNVASLQNGSGFISNSFSYDGSTSGTPDPTDNNVLSSTDRTATENLISGLIENEVVNFEDIFISIRTAVAAGAVNADNSVNASTNYSLAVGNEVKYPNLIINGSVLTNPGAALRVSYSSSNDTWTLSVP